MPTTIMIMMKVLVTLLLLVINAVAGDARYLRQQNDFVTASFQDELLLDQEDAMLWDRLLAEESSLSMSMPCSSCVPSSVPEFEIEDNVDIGDVLTRPGPGFAQECGCNCITVKDNGDDPPYDPELGDTLRFAYKTVSNEFSIRSRVCGTDCDGDDGDEFGRTGLMVRSSLDPLAANVFASHSPNLQADWSYRVNDGDSTTVHGSHGSPDVPCLWITLERHGNDFIFSYAYEGDDECTLDTQNSLDALTQSVTIDMPERVYVGLVVSTAVSPPHCRYTEADFKDIECRGCT